MWDVTSMGVRGLAWSIFDITSWWDFTSMRVIRLAPWSQSILKSTSWKISNLKYFSLKNVALSLHIFLSLSLFFFPFTQFFKVLGKVYLKNIHPWFRQWTPVLSLCMEIRPPGPPKNFKFVFSNFHIKIAKISLPLPAYPPNVLLNILE